MPYKKRIRRTNHKYSSFAHCLARIPIRGGLMRMFRKALLCFSVAFTLFASCCDAKTIRNSTFATKQNGDSGAVARQPTNVTVDSILGFLENRETQIEHRPGENIILIIGRTGTGKSTLTQFLAENDRLQSVIDDGEIVINDEAGKISSGSTTHSYTSIPTRVRNNRTTTSFYDCPPFEDTRGVLSDISNSYLIQSLLRKGSRVKFILVEDHHNLKINGERTLFLNLVRQVSALITDIGKFNASIALCANKVTSPTLSDEQVISYVAKFINSTRGDFAEGSSEWSLINILLTQTNNQNGSANYTRIGLLRAPSKLGSIEDMLSFRKNKRILDDIVYKNLTFTKVEDSDFGYVIADSSKLHELADQVAAKISSSIGKLIQSIAIHFQWLETGLTADSIAELAAQYTSACSYLLDVKQQLEESQDLDLFVEHTIAEMSIKLNVTFKPLVISSITTYRNDLQFLQKVSNDSTVQVWSTIFPDDEFEVLNRSQRWYSFFSKCYDGFGSYSVQKSHQKYNLSEFTTTLDRLLADSEPTEFSVQQIGLKKFVGQFPSLELSFNLEANMMVSRLRVGNMRKMVKTFLEYQVQVLPLTSNILIQGRYITFSNVMHHLTNKTFKTIEIFATKTVFIDASLNRTGTLDQLAIIAPQWSIVTSAEASISIILNGANGQPLGRARDGQSAEKPNGEDGKPGNTGGTAGNFLGLGTKFVSIDKLRVSVSGGNGSSGQDGGNGLDGRDGESPLDANIVSNGSNCHLYVSSGFNYDTITYSQCVTAACQKDPILCCAWIVNAKSNSTDGGNAGDGGAAGEAGQRGTVKVMMLPTGEFPANLSLYDQIGTKASNGRPGTAGQAAKLNAYDLNPISWIQTSIMRINSNGDQTSEKPEEICRKKSYLHTSVSGKPGKSGSGIPSQPANKTKPFIHPDKIVNRYKKFIRTELMEISGGLPETSGLKFLKYLETSPNVAELYEADLFRLAADLQILETQYFEYANKVNPTIFQSNFRFFQDHVLEVANCFNGSKDHHLSNFSNLNAAAMTMITALNYRTSNSLIIEITSYLDLLLDRIKEYKNFKIYVKKANLQDQFQQQIKHSIEEAHNMIINSLNTEIDKVFDRINDDTAQLIIDVEGTAKEAQGRVKQLQEQHKKLKNSMLLIGVLNVVETCSMLLGFLGLIGVGISAVIKGGAEIGKKVVSVDALQNLSALPCSATLASMTDRLRQEGLVFKDQLSEGITLLEKTNAAHNEVKELKEEFQAAQKTIEQEEKKNQFNSVAPDIVQLLRQTLRQQLEKRGQTTEHSDIKSLCNQLQITIGITADFVYLYHKIKPAGTSELAKLDRAIQEAEKAGYQLNRFKKAIYADLIPMFQNIHTNVNNLGVRLEHDSHASLAVSKWKVQQTLDNVIYMLDSMSTVFSITEDMADCVKKVEQGTSLIIDIYDTIQDYEDRSQMVSYIYDMSRTDLGQNTDMSVRSVLDNITTLVETHIILGEYFNAMSNIKPYVFPFPTYFLGNIYSLPIPSSSGPPQFGSAQLEEMLEAVSQNITFINTRIKIDQLEVKGEYDQYIRQSVFKRSRSSTPFYTGEGLPGLVQLLLRGEKITVTAKVQDQIKNAVKFKEIGIYLRIQSATGNMTAEEVEAQKDLDSKLENYLVYMTHLGVSYFRCADTFYMMRTNDDLTFSFSFEKDEKGEPMDKNNVYDKVSQGMYVLSPYTTWQIWLKPVLNYATKKAALLKQSGTSSTLASTEFLNKNVDFLGSGALLQPIQGANSSPFSEFEPFLNRSIILELEGKGQYLDPEGGSKICVSERVSDYYTKVRSLP